MGYVLNATDEIVSYNIIIIRPRGLKLHEYVSVGSCSENREDIWIGYNENDKMLHNLEKNKNNNIFEVNITDVYTSLRMHRILYTI